MQQRRWGAGVVTAGAVMLLMWLVTAPSPRLFDPPRMPLHLPRMPQHTRAPRTPPPARSSTATFTRDAGSDGAAMNPLASWVWMVLATVLIAAAVTLVLAWAVRKLLELRRDVQLDEAEVEALPEVPEALVAEPDAFRRTLLQGEPRNGIVACWARLEDAARDAGVPMAAHETSSEYTERVVGSWVRDDAALRRLAELYRVARFSQHELSEADRSAAGEVLDALLTDLRTTWEARRDRE